MMLPLVTKNGIGGGGFCRGRIPNVQPNYKPTSSLTKAQQQQHLAQVQQKQYEPGNYQGSRYKTELCRPFKEFNFCNYGDNCQFAHGQGELRKIQRHPKYKTKLCRTFHTSGLCPYGYRCHFIHNSDEINMQQNGNNNNNSGSASTAPTRIIGTGLPTTKDLVTHRSSSMSSNSSTASSSNEVGSGGSSPVYNNNHHLPQLPPFYPSPHHHHHHGCTTDSLAAANRLNFGMHRVSTVAAAAQAPNYVLSPLSQSHSHSFCSGGFSVPSLSSSQPLSATTKPSLSTATHFYAPVNFYTESNKRLPVFCNLSR